MHAPFPEPLGRYSFSNLHFRAIFFREQPLPMPYLPSLDRSVSGWWSRPLPGHRAWQLIRLDFLGSAAARGIWEEQRALVVCSNDDGEDDLDIGDDDGLTTDDPLADEESSFDDFDDDFDDDFEEEETDPDWDHPGDLEPEAPPPGKPSGGKK